MKTLVMDAPVKSVTTVGTTTVTEAEVAKTIVKPDLIKWNDRIAGLYDYGWQKLQKDWWYTGRDLKRALQEAEALAGWLMEAIDDNTYD